MTQAQALGLRLPKKTAKLFLIDGNSFCYRAFYAIRSLSNSRGEPTNAIYGFITMMRKLVQTEAPDYMAICFDRHEPTFRHERYEAYKAHRKPMPDELVAQIEPIKECCRAYRYAMFEKAGFEADDLIGTLARRAEDEGLQVVIVTGDKDAMQLVNERVKILNPSKEDLLYDAEQVKKRFDGLGPDKVVDIMALMGDASDNIPGVQGIGEKTAVKLIKEFGSVENLLAKISKIHSKSQQELIREHADQALLSKELAAIDTHVSVEIDWQELEIKPPDDVKLTELFKRYEFKSLLKDIMPVGESQPGERSYHLIRTDEEFKDFVLQLSKADAFSFDTETTSSDAMRAHLVGMSFSWKTLEAFYLPVRSKNHRGEGLPIEEAIAALKPILENPAKKKYGQNVKYDWIVMKRHGVSLQGFAFDTMIASYLINPIKLNHNLDDISLEYLSVKKVATAQLIGKGKEQITMDQVPLEDIARYAAEDADCVFRLVSILRAKLEELGLVGLFEDVEMPLAEVLAKVEMNGVHLDLKFLKELSDNAAKDLENLTQEIYREAGEEFNINSTKQLADILFVKMKLPIIKRTKTGYSTDVNLLERLARTY
ncbi:MAG: DNA polymerase, partial [Candidatus Omnitrophica bacterium]|nr:DNA polymerase [Candidatus Omnitrophota bacterium]